MAEPRAAFPRDDITPNENDPATHPPGTVGSPDPSPGDPHGLLFEGGPAGPSWPRSVIRPSAWSGWPAEWDTPNWWGRARQLAETAWLCVDKNASVLSTMPPYLVSASDSLPQGWLQNPDPELYGSWCEFAKQLFWDYQLGEAFVLCTARYSTGYPARFHVVAPWLVNAEKGPDGRRRYRIGNEDVTGDIRHFRYNSTTDNARGTGPLDVAAPRLVVSEMLTRYVSNLAASGGVPHSILTHPNRLSAEQAADLQTAWVEARMSSIGLPAVLSGGLEYEPLSIDPEKMALVDLARFNESRIAYLFGVPGPLVGLPSGQDSLTYNTNVMIREDHWHGGLKPKATTVMADLSQWLLPLGTTVELNRDDYIMPGPVERAGMWGTLLDKQVLTIDEVRERERFSVAAPTQTLTSGVLQ